MKIVNRKLRIAKFKQFLLIYVIIIFTALAWHPEAKAGSNAGMAGAFLRLGLGARALGMGDVGVAIPGSGYGIYYNPASLPLLDKMTVLTSYSYLSLDRHFNFVGFAAPLHPAIPEGGESLSAGLGVGWINAGPGDLEERDKDGKSTGTFSNSENAFYFSFALRFGPKISLGISPKILYNTFPDLTEGESFYSARLGFDAGILINPATGLFLGIQARHINAQYRWDTATLYGDEGTTQVDKFPRIYRFGASYSFDFGLLLAGELESSDQNDQEVHIGAEYKFVASDQYEFTLRSGYDDQDYAFGFGFGFDVWHVRGQLDYVYQLQNVPPYDSQVISLAFIP